MSYDFTKLIEELNKPKERPTRCCFTGCKKKLLLSDFPCRCGEFHCSSHRASEAHSCTYDYKKDNKEFLLKTMSTAVIGKKIDMI